MTPEEIKRLRKRLGYTGVKAARLIGVTARAWRRYEEGSREMPEPIIRLMLMMERIPRVRFALEELAANGSLESFDLGPSLPLR